MRVALTVTRSDVFGGAVVHVRDLCLGLRRRGHDVEVFIGGNGPFSDHLRAHGVPVRTIPSLVRAISPAKDALALRELVRELRDFDPDVIHAHTGKAGWLTRVAARMLGTPFVYSPHCWPFLDDLAAPRRRLYLQAERVAGRLPGTTVSVCDFEKQVAVESRVGTPNRHVVVHNGVEDVAGSLLARADRQDRAPHLVVVARFEPQKDHATIVEALGRLRDLEWRATFIGDGPLREACRARLRELGLEDRVAFPGEVDEVGRWLAEAQVFVLMSNWEGLPLTVLEAMRAALPVVASRTGGVPEAVADGETGLLVGRGDVEGLERSLSRLLQDPAARGRMGAAGRARFLERFTIDRMIDALERLYVSVATPATEAAPRPVVAANGTPAPPGPFRPLPDAPWAHGNRNGNGNGNGSGPAVAHGVPGRALDGLRAARRRGLMATSGLRSLPDFLVIGTQRGGTTSLYRYMTAHPMVRAAQCKEIHYFDAEYGRGSAWYRSHFPLAGTDGRAPRLQTGEATPYYLFHPHAPQRVAALVPDVRVIVLLRDPVQRAYSHYHHELAKGREELTFEEAVAREAERLDGELERMTQDPGYDSARLRHHSYVARGRYAEQLDRWYAAFPPGQVLVLRSEDLYGNAAATVDEVDRFLGLPPRKPALYRQHNGREYDDLPPAVSERLREVFAPHNQRLYALVGRDFGWEG